MSAHHHLHTSDKPLRINPALCQSALSRLAWGLGALIVLWGAVFWAMS